MIHLVTHRLGCDIYLSNFFTLLSGFVSQLTFQTGVLSIVQAYKRYYCVVHAFILS